MPPDSSPASACPSKAAWEASVLLAKWAAVFIQPCAARTTDAGHHRRGIPRQTTAFRSNNDNTVEDYNMSDKKPVVVYGVSGYTGRLVCEYLRELNVPFIAAGRDKERVQAVVDKIPGMETADYEVVGVEHSVAALTECFRGAKVVCNMVGPFIKYGPETVEAALAAGCHYQDTTGEQDWVLEAKTKWGDKFAAKGLLLSPGVAQMYTTGEIAAQLCLETPGLDTLDIAVFWGGSPTIASTATILVNAAMAKAYYLEQNKYVEHQPDAGLYSLAIPGQHELALALPWGGTSHPV